MLSGAHIILRRRLTELWGVGFLIVAALLALALLSYDPADPSPFNAPGSTPGNLLGLPGALIADPLMRFVGLAAWVLVLFPAVWGLRFVLHRGDERIWARMLFLPLALILGAAFAATHAAPPDWPLLPVGVGGLFGDAGAGALMRVLPIGEGPSIRFWSFALGLATGLVLAATLGVTRGEMLGVAEWMVVSVATVLGGGRSMITSPTSDPLVLSDPDEAGAENAPAVQRHFGGFGLKRFGQAGARPRGVTPKFAEARGGPSSEWLDETPDFKGLGAEGTRSREPVAAMPGGTDTESALAGQSALGHAIRALRTGDVRDLDSPGGSDAVLGVDQAAAMSALLGGGSAPAPPGHGARSEPPLAPTPEPEDDELDTADEDDDGDLSPMPPVYDRPPLGLLQAPPEPESRGPDPEERAESARQLETVLSDYGVRGEITAVKTGPVVTLYELEPAPGLKASRVIGLSDDIARSMSALSARVSTVPGRTVIGIELPNPSRETVFLRELFRTANYRDCAFPLALALGKDIQGGPVVANLAKMPHLLIAGTTGSGKSVAINTMILSLLYRLPPEECRLIMIDPKMLELSVYDGIPHLLAPVVTDPKKALVALKWVVAEMEERYRKMSKLGVRNIDGYNARVREALARGEAFERTVRTGFDEETGEPTYETEVIEPEHLPFIVVIVDEMADLMMVAGKEIEACIQRLAQMARASGIHLIMATQRPSVDVITGTIKANFPTRISFQVTSKIDSRTILGEQGAEQLLGQGDMLLMAPGGRIRRVHGPFVSDDEVEEVVRHLKTLGPPDYVSDVTDGGPEEMQALVDEKLGLASAGDSEDELYDKAVAIVARDRKCSTSYIQRKLQIGYNKAARLVEEMEDQGVVSPANAVGKREILIEER